MQSSPTTNSSAPYYVEYSGSPTSPSRSQTYSKESMSTFKLDMGRVHREHSNQVDYSDNEDEGATNLQGGGEGMRRRTRDDAEHGQEMASNGHAEPSSSGIPVPAIISPRKQGTRAIFIDWVRSISVYIVVIVHIFVSIQRIIKPNPIMQEKIEGSFRVVLQFGMPLFFYFSARSAAFGKAPFLPFLVAKIKRLLIPCIIGFLIIVIPTCYIGRKFRPCVSYDARNMDFLPFYKNYFTEQIKCNGIDWYWFLPVLFFISVLNQYFLSWIKNRYGVAKREGFVFKPRSDIGPLVFVVVLIGGLLGAAHGLKMPLDLVGIGLAPYFILYVLVLVTAKIHSFQLMYLFYLATPLPSLVLAGYIKGKYTEGGTFDSISDIVIMCLFYNHFYIEGYIDEVFDADWKRWRDSAKTHAAMKPLALLGMIVFLAIGSPTTSNPGYLYTYPLYKSVWYICVMYVLGTWLYIALWLRYSQTFYNEILNRFEYTHITTSSMLVYMIHWLFIDTISVWFVVPYPHLTLMEGVLIVLTGTAICCALVYLAIYGVGAWLRARAEKFVNGGGFDNKKHIDESPARY